MKYCKKLPVIIMAIIFIAMPFSGCTELVGERVNPNQTQLYVANLNSGLRDMWLQALKVRFEKAYADTSFEEGETGVQIIVDNNAYSGFGYLDRLSGDPNEVYFTENVMYYDFVSKNLFADITDAVTENLVEFGEEQSIEDKLSNDTRDFYKTDEGKYFALPFYEAYSCIAYDIDLFEEKGFYFAKGGCPSEYSEFTQANNTDKAAGSFGGTYKYVGEFGNRSAGPDGKYGTDDDGLPATYDEFFVLTKKMQTSGVRSMIWPGKYPDYINETANMLWADYEGKEKAAAFYKMQGDDIDILSFDGDTPIITPTDIRNENGYMFYSQAGRYYAIDFLHRLISGGTYDPDAFGEEVTHINSQERFLYGRFESSMRTIAMLADGTWWQNEATDAYNTLVDVHGDDASKMSRRIGLLPLPKVSEKNIGEAQTYLSTKQTACFVNKNVTGKKLELAKTFIRFAHTDESLKEFMTIVNMPKPFKFDMNEEELNKLTVFGRDIYKAHSSGNVVFTASKNPIYRATPNKFMAVNGFETMLPNDLPATVVGTAFKDNPAFTAREYFENMKKYSDHTESKWRETYGQYFDYNAE